MPLDALNMFSFQPKLSARRRFFLVPSPRIALNLTRTYTVEENHIGSAVSEILWYRQTARDSYTLLVMKPRIQIEMSV